MGVDAIEIKDPSGLLTPQRAAELIPKLRAVTAGKELQLHSHCTNGYGLDTYMQALALGDQGVDTFHCASRPLAFGYSLPPHDAVLDALADHGCTADIDRDALDEMQAYFGMLTRRTGRPVGRELPKVTDLGPQVPGGMMSNLIQQLKDQGQEHRLAEVLEEIARVREDLGFPILVSPMAQYVGTQGVLKVLCGKRYQMVPQEIRQYVLGYYGEVVGRIDPKVRELIAGDEPSITVPPSQLTARITVGIQPSC